MKKPQKKIKKGKTIAISLSPNATKRDVWISIKTLFKPWTWKNVPEVIKLEDKFKEYLDINHAVTFESGRGCLFAILKAMNIGEGDEVIVQGYTCVVVSNSVLWTGAKPVYVDINEDDLNLNLEDLKSKITDKTKAIITQSSFGQPNDLPEIMEIANEHGIKLIEDCAHSLGSEFDGRKLGTFGDAAFFSFGRDKIISSVHGGIAVTNDAELATKLKDFKAKLKFQSSFRIFQHLMHPIIFSLVIPLYNVLNIGKIILVSAQKLRLISKVIQPDEKKGKQPKDLPSKFPNALAKLALNQLEHLTFFNAHRIKLSNLYSERLANLPVKLPPKIEGKKNVYLRYNIMVDDAKALRKFAKEQNILLGDWYDTVIAPKYIDASEFEYKENMCPIAEKIAKEIVNLPTHHKVTEKDAERVCEVIQNFLNTQNHGDYDQTD